MSKYDYLYNGLPQQAHEYHLAALLTVSTGCWMLETNQLYLDYRGFHRVLYGRYLSDDEMKARRMETRAMLIAQHPWLDTVDAHAVRLWPQSAIYLLKTYGYYHKVVSHD